MWQALLDRLPRGYTLEEEDWQRRHRLLLWVLALHVPGLAVFGLVLGTDLPILAGALAGPLLAVIGGRLLGRHRRSASVVVTAGLSYSSAALVVITQGSIEAHFHFFIIIGFIALYQDWAPFLFNIVFTVLSHGLGSVFSQNLIFAHLAGQTNPWLWSLIHGIAVLFACVGMMLFWRVTEESQQQKEALAKRLAEAEIARRQFASDMLVNLARRNQGMVYRQLDIINQLEESEQDPDALAELFKLDHLATRVRRNAESLLVLSGEQPARVWSEPIPLRDVVRAAIAETEDLDRVVFLVGDEPAVAGSAVTDLTHLLAELTENAVRFSPPDSSVTIRARPDTRGSGAQLLTVEDWGVGMPTEQLEAANALLAEPPEVDMSVSKRLGFHVVARLAARHAITVTLYATPGSGVTAAIGLPAALFEATGRVQPALSAVRPTVPTTPGAVAEGERMRRRVPSQRGPLTALDDDRSEDTTRLRVVPEPAPVRLDPVEPAATGGTSGLSASARDAMAALGNRRARPTPAADDEEEAFRRTGWWGDAANPDGANPGPAAAAPTPAPRTGNGELRAVPSPRPQPAAPDPAAGAAAAEREHLPADHPGAGEVGAEGAPFTLRRRTPQAHLTPELRRPTATESPAPAVPAAGAASALSRYQASRQAARDIVEGGSGEAGHDEGW
jgi:signal transduction histidine kinase